MADPKIKKLAKDSVGRSPTKNMAKLLNILSSTIIPNVDKYYTFIYKAKTPGIVYDAHPLVKVSGIFVWGFVGFNFHWGESRQYTWADIVSNLYEVPEEDMQTVLAINTFRRKKS